MRLPTPSPEAEAGRPEAADAGAEAARPERASARWLRPRNRRPLRLAVESTAVATVAQVLAVAVYGMWSGRRVAEAFGRGDLVFHTALVRSMQLTGGHSAGPFLGAPNGQDLTDFPLGGDRIHLLALRVLAELPISAISVVNLYYLLSFAVIAGVTHVTLRSLGSDVAPAAGASILFAFLPYHLGHGFSHLFLSMYPAVPLGVLLAVWVADGRLGRHAPRWRWAVAAVAVVVLGSTSAYYAVFGAICIVTAAAVGSLRGRNLRPLLIGAGTAAAVAVVLVANVTPTLLHRRAEGENIEAGQRTRLETEVYGLRPATLVVPDPTHRVPAFARRGLDANQVPNPGELGSYLGLVGVLGLLVLLGACFAALADVRVPPVLGLLGAMFLVMLLVGARGGGGFLFALAGFTDIRSWGRTSLVIGLLGLGALALIATAATRRRGRPAVALVTVLLVALGLFDQVPAEPIPDRAAGVADVRIERELVHEMEDALPAGATVYQLPYTRFPEGGPRLEMIDYDQLRPYVLGRGRLRWSAGGMRGRSGDWQELWAPQPAPVLLRAVAAAGFSALLVDLRAYGDAGDDLVAEISDVTGAQPRRSRDGKLAWFDIRAYGARVRADLGPGAEEVGRAVTSIPRAVWARGFDPLSGPPPGPRLAEDGALLELRSATGARQSAVLLLTVDVPAGVSVTVGSEDASWRSAGAGVQHGRVALELGEGPTEVRFHIEGADSLLFSRLAAVDAAALRLLPEPPAPR